MKKVIKYLSGRLAVTSYLILLQLCLLFVGVLSFSNKFVYFYLIMMIISFICVIVIVNDDSNPTFKIAWIIPILIVPIFGAPLYFIFGKKKVSNKVVNKLVSTFKNTCEILEENSHVTEEITIMDKRVAKQFMYVNNTSYSPVYSNTQTKFLSTGEIFYTNLLIELEKAEKFIFLEYFIIGKGKMWDSVLDILKRKALSGVDVRLMYDDLGTINLLEKNYPKYLESFGIKTEIFNPFHASLDSFMNYRDHRKITVIDGNVGFTGGINLADEYINEVARFGYWKDSSVMLKGDAVSRLTVMFLQIWYYLAENQESQEYSKFMSTVSYDNDGYVQPFGDSPLSGHLTGEYAYMNMINNAQKYVYITTPYLVLDNEMITVLKLAADSGVEIRIIMPYKPDKWYVHAVSRANYPVLLNSGIKIYEYTPGFIHAKTIVVDDEMAIVGTTNFDFRSFYLHFENGVLMYKSACVKEVHDDYLKMIDVSKQITLESYYNESRVSRIKGKILKLFSPMM